MGIPRATAASKIAATVPPGNVYRRSMPCRSNASTMNSAPSREETLAKVEAPVDVERLAGHVRRGSREIGDRLRHLAGLPRPPERDLAQLVLAGGRCDLGLGHLGLDQAGRHAVDRDVRRTDPRQGAREA